MSGKRLFTGIAVLLLAAGVLGLLECSLRLFTAAPDTGLTHEVTYDGIEWYELNRAYLKKYFPPGTPLIPEFKPALIRKVKASRGFRIICLGESSMFGTPYEMTCSIPGIIRKQLRHLFPGRELEVLNLGASAINSNVIRNVAPALARYDPDLVLIYMGHNEFYGPDGIGAPPIQKYFPSSIQATYDLRDLRIVNLLLGLLRPSRARPDAQGDANLMKQVSLGSAVRLHSSEADRTFSLFENNLTAVLRIFRERGIPVIVSDVASNLEFPPFQSETLAGSAGDSAVYRIIESENAEGRYPEAIARLEPLARADSTNALLHFRLGTLYAASGAVDRARAHLKAARDFDLLKFRAPGMINAIIRRVCSDERVPFVSSDSMLASNTPSGIPGDQFFWEHLHPNERGYYLIAGLFVQTIVDLHLLEAAGEPPPRGRPLPLNADSLSICWLDLAYGDLSIQHLTGRWPFENYRKPPAVIASAPRELLRIVHDVYDRKILWDEGCYKTAEYYWGNGAVADARTTYEALLEEHPDNFYANYLLGNLLVKTGAVSEGIPFFERSIRSNPRYPNSRRDLGLVEINAGKFDDAIGQLTEALKAAGGESPPALRASIHYGLAAAQANKGNLKGALEEADSALRLLPGYSDAVALRKSILEHTAR